MLDAGGIVKVLKLVLDRKLKLDARPIQNLSNPAGLCSAADSRLTVYESVDLAKKFW